MLNPVELTRLAHSLNGLPIMGCSSGSPAARAGLRYGDIVLSLDDVPTPSWSAFLRASGPRGRSARMRVFRQGATVELELSLSRALHTPRAVLDAPARVAPADFS